MIRLLYALLIIPIFASTAFAQESLHGGIVANFDDYVENVSLKQDCILECLQHSS